MDAARLVFPEVVMKRGNDERDKRYARIAKARKAQKRKTRQ